MLSPNGLSKCATAVACALAEYANGDGTSCYPSQDTIAADTKWSTRAVRTALAELEAGGWIHIERRPVAGGPQGRAWRSDYLLILPEEPASGSSSPLGEPEGRSASSDTNRESMPSPPAKSRQMTIEEPAHGAGNPERDQENIYTLDFEQAWASYPKRYGSNPKRAAYRAWHATLKRGSAPSELLSGTQRYAAWCDAEGKTGTEFVKQARTFFGREEHWREDWRVRDSRHDGAQTASVTVSEMGWLPE